MSNGDFSLHLFSNSSKSELIPVQVRVFIHRIININPLTNTFNADITIFLTYPHKPLDEVASSKWWTPEVQPWNGVELEEKTRKEFKYDIKERMVTQSRRFQGSFESKMDITHYPFDSQLLCISFHSVTYTDSDFASDDTFYVELQRPSISCSTLTHSEWNIGEPSLGIDVYEGELGDTYSRAIVQIPVCRKSAHHLTMSTLPMFLVMNISWCSFFISYSEFILRIIFLAICLVALSILRFGGATNLPPVNYPTSAHFYATTCYILIFFVVIETLIITQINFSSAQVVDQVVSYIFFASFLAFTAAFCSKPFFQKPRYI